MIKVRYWTWSDVPALIDLEQASILLGLSTDAVRRYCTTGDIPAMQIGRQWHIEKQKFMEKFGYE